MDEKKYANLFARIERCGVVGMLAEGYPENIIIPTEGYIVPDPDSMQIADDGTFDECVEYALDLAKTTGFPALLFHQVEEKGDIIIEIAKWFKSKEYAFGFSEGIDSDVVFDAFNDHLISVERGSHDSL